MANGNDEGLTNIPQDPWRVAAEQAYRSKTGGSVVS
jgi:hypothetical protein